MSEWFRARTIVEDDGVRSEADKYSGEYSRFDDVWEGLKWLLARKGPDLNCLRKTENGQEFHLYKAAQMGKDVPIITVVFTVSDNEIRIHGMKAENEEAGQTATVTEIRSNG